jgi:hypothetical protein
MPTKKPSQRVASKRSKRSKPEDGRAKKPQRDGETSDPVPTLKTPVDPGTQRGPCDVPKGHQRKAS